MSDSPPRPSKRSADKSDQKTNAPNKPKKFDARKRPDDQANSNIGKKSPPVRKQLGPSN
jgi:hypothetical protein